MIRAVAQLCAVFFFMFAPLKADEVKLFDKPAFRNVRVTGFSKGVLSFRGVSGQTLRKPLVHVEYVLIEQVESLVSAEKAAIRQDWPAAIQAYRHATAAEPAWVRDLARLRLLQAYDAAGRFADGVKHYADLLETKAGVLEPFRPRSIPGPTSPELGAARRCLERAIFETRSSVSRERLREILLEIIIYDASAEVPLWLGVPPGTLSTPRRWTAALPAGSDDAGSPNSADAEIADPTPKRREPRSRQPKLAISPDSWLLPAARALSDEGNFADAHRVLRDAMSFLPREGGAPWRMVYGITRIEIGEPAEAAEDLLALAENLSNAGSASDAADAVMAAEALYYVGFAHERLDRPDVAESIYRELLGRPDCPAGVCEKAQAGLVRVREN